MKRGFTLVELLAVILVVGFIAAIATPIFIKIINETKINSAGINITNYMKAVKLSIENYSSVNKGAIPAGTYQITNNGKSLTNGTGNIKVLAKGEKLESGTIIINDNGEVILKNGVVKGINKIYNSIGKKTTSLNIVTNGDGLYKSDNGRYIYRGENPNNYIWIDENGDGINPTDKSELYRIISYESDGTIKVIRNERIINPTPHRDETQDTFSWDTRDTTVGTRQNTTNSYCNYGTNSDGYYGCNAWGNMSDTYFQGNLLGTSFYYKYYENASTTTLNSNSTNKTVGDNSTLNDYLNNEWLSSNSTLNNYIEEHFFNVGGPMYYTTYIGGDQGIDKEKYQEYLSTWKGKVGLMNITEYTDASLDNSCTSVYNSYYYNPKYYYDKNGDGTKTQNNTTDVWPCKTKNYLYKYNYTQWSLSAHSYYHLVAWSVSFAGYLNHQYTFGGFIVRPAFYLKSTINISGEGTETNPFTLEQ